MIIASNWRSISGHRTLQGWLTLSLKPSGLVLNDCSVHLGEDGQRWIALPSKPLLDASGRHKTDLAGKKQYVPVVEIEGRTEREKFQKAGLAALDRLLLGPRAKEGVG